MVQKAVKIAEYRFSVAHYECSNSLSRVVAVAMDAEPFRLQDRLQIEHRLVRTRFRSLMTM